MFKLFKKNNKNDKGIQTKTSRNQLKNQLWRKEIDIYLSQGCASEEENVLQWWRSHEKQFPNLARMARDLLCIQATSVSAGRLFSRSSLTIRKHRNKLNNESIRNLMCLNSWVTCSLAPKIQDELPKNC